MKILKAKSTESGYEFDIYVDESKILPDNKKPDPRYVIHISITGGTLEDALSQAKSRADNYLAHLNRIDGIQSVSKDTLSDIEGKSLNQILKNGIDIKSEVPQKPVKKPTISKDNPPTDLVPTSTEKDSDSAPVAMKKEPVESNDRETPDVNKEEGDKDPENPTPVIGDEKKKKTSVAKKTKVKK